MLNACLEVFPACHGLIAAAAPCDYRPLVIAPHKIGKTGRPLRLELVETPDIVAPLAPSSSTNGWSPSPWRRRTPRMRAMQKLERKSCDLIVLNGPAAVQAADTRVEVLGAAGQVLAALAGPKDEVAQGILRVIAEQLMR